MNKKILNKLILSLICFFISFLQCFSQCNNAIVNWDNLDYLSTNSIYQYHVTSGMSRSQKFAIGRSSLQVNATGLTIIGDTSIHTNHTGSFGAGDDVRYTGQGTITMIFRDSASNIQFSIYDLDNSQQATVTATAVGGANRTVTLGQAAAASFAFTGNPGNTPSALSNATNVALTANTRTLNVSISSFVKTITIVIDNNAGDADGIFLSDVKACVPGGAPAGPTYYDIARPFTGMPTYFFATSDTNIVHIIDTTTGIAIEKFLVEPSFRFVNSLAYDPHKHRLYYTEDNGTAGGGTTFHPSKKIYYYDYETETNGVLLDSLPQFNVPVFNRGMNSAAAAFYDGFLYIGVEGARITTNDTRENILWRIKFASDSITPEEITQMYAVNNFYHLVSDGTYYTSIRHDWGDIVVNNGILYDFNVALNGISSRQYNLMTDSILLSHHLNNTTGFHRPRQSATLWNGTSYSVWDSLSFYNNATGQLSPKKRITGVGWRPSGASACNDASGPFKPKTDFGDAPASYDPVGVDPATHLRDTALRLGNSFDREFVKIPSANADGDGADEDAIGTVSVLSSLPSQNVVISVNVYNNTGSNATLVGWIDADKDGIFDSWEGTTLTVNSMTTMQVVDLAWTGLNTSALNNGDKIFLRIRISTSGSLTSSTPNGYFSNGEVEDYPVIVDEILPIDFLSLYAVAKNENTATIHWQLSDENDIAEYQIQHSANSTTNFADIGTVTKNNSGTNSIPRSFDHNGIQSINNYYRIKVEKLNGTTAYSPVKKVVFGKLKSEFTISPNPAHGFTVLQMESAFNSTVDIEIWSTTGVKVYSKKAVLSSGMNNIILDNLPNSSGLYHIKVNKKGEPYAVKKIIIH